MNHFANVSLVAGLVVIYPLPDCQNLILFDPYLRRANIPIPGIGMIYDKKQQHQVNIGIGEIS